MGKGKRKLTAPEKAEKRRCQSEFMTIFIRGKMKRVQRSPMVEGLPVEEFIRRNADPIWLLQNEMRECIEESRPNDLPAILDANGSSSNEHIDDDDSCPF